MLYVGMQPDLHRRRWSRTRRRCRCLGLTHLVVRRSTTTTHIDTVDRFEFHQFVVVVRRRRWWCRIVPMFGRIRIRIRSRCCAAGFGFAHQSCLRESIDTVRPFLILQGLGGQGIQFELRRFDTFRQLCLTRALL